ncbi:MAG: T9SS type A sorting domain-containing protein [Salibacteraceae bacterium]
MKKFLLVIMFIGGTLGLAAQSITPGTYSDTLRGSTTELTINNQIDIINSGNSNVYIHVVRKEKSLITGSKNNFCWGPLCYPDFVSESTSSVFLTPNGSDSTFKAQYSPLGTPGFSTIRYCFYDSLNAGDSTCFDLVFEAITPPVGIDAADDLQKVALSNAFPNPASSIVSFQYDTDQPGNSYLVIRNVLGAEVARRVLRNNHGTVVMPTSNMENGIYLYSLETAGDTVVTRRLVVAH